MSFAHLYQKPADRQFVYDQIKQRTELLKKTEKQLEFLKNTIIKFKGEAEEYLTMGGGTFTLEDDEDGGYSLTQHFDVEATAAMCHAYSDIVQLQATGCEHKIKMLKTMYSVKIYGRVYFVWCHFGIALVSLWGHVGITKGSLWSPSGQIWNQQEICKIVP